MTYGELLDHIAAHGYREYLETRKRAQLACWICNGAGMRTSPLYVEDLVGYWAGGKAMGKLEYWQWTKEQALRNKGRGESGGHP